MYVSVSKHKHVYRVSGVMLGEFVGLTVSYDKQKGSTVMYFSSYEILQLFV